MNPAQGQLPGQGSGSGQGAQSPTQQPQQPPGVTQGQGGQNQNQGQNPNLNGNGYFQPAQIRALNILSDEEKNKYVAGLEGLWAKIKSSPTGSNEYKQASEKIWNFSKMLQNKITQRQAQIRAHQASMQQQQAQQAQQTQQQGQQPQQPQQPQQTQQAQQPQQPQQTPQQTQQQRPQAQNQQPRQQPAPQQQVQQPQPPQPPQQQQQPQQPQPPRPQAAAQKPQNQNQGQQQTAQNAATPNQNQASGQQPQQANSQPGRMPENIMNHLRQLKIKGLPDFDNKPAAEQQKHINDLRTRYGRALMSVDLAKSRLRAIDSTTQKRSQEGKPFTEEEMKRINEQKAQQQKIHYDASKWIEGFRKQHVISEGNTAQGANQNAQAGNGGAAAAPAGQQGAPNRVSSPSQNAAAQQAQAQIQAQQRPQLANNGGQNQQAGRGQAPNAQGAQTTNTGGPGRALSHQAAMSLANQRAANTANNAQAQAQQGGGQSQAAGTPTSAGGAPAANAQQPAPQQPQQQQQQQQQAQQAQQPPSQQQTPVQQQQQQPPPPQQGHPHAHPTQAQTQMHSKMPIPKVLPEKATGVPQPVQTGGGVKGSRPTMNQGTGTMGSSMHQPAIQKIPAYNNEAEGDHVLSKKKLDELVRQVCGGSSDGQEGNLLSPDVEENVLNMADSFVDNVLHAASRNAKERGSKMLEIRDIQLVLERTYNIRVPGYSSDELRTVRKVQPTTGWIAKMSAVQAAKVMPGKGE